MGLFKKKDLFNDTPVMSGGNSKAIHEQQQAQVDIDKATIAYSNHYNSLNTNISKVMVDQFSAEQYDIWRLLNFQADYYCNLFTVQCESTSLLWAIQTAQRVAFIYGVSGIYWFGNRYIPFYVRKSELGIDGQYIRMQIAPATTILPQQSQLPKKYPVLFTLEAEDIAKNVAIFKWDTLALGAWYKFGPFINQQKRMFEMLTTEGYSLIKKFDYKVNDPSAFIEEFKLYYSTNNPYIISSKVGDEFSNKINMLQVNSGSAQNFVNYFYEWQNIWYQILGRRNNTDMKKERNVTNEVEASQSNFDILETDHYLHFKVFVKRLEEMLGIKLIERSIYDINGLFENNGEGEK